MWCFVHRVQPYSHDHFCTGIPPHRIFFPFQPALTTTVQCVISRLSYDLIPSLTSPLTYIHSCLAGFWSGSAASVTWFRVCSVSPAQLCVCLCQYVRVTCLFVYIYMWIQSQRSDNPPKANRSRSYTQVCRVMTQSISHGSLSHWIMHLDASFPHLKAGFDQLH